MLFTFTVVVCILSLNYYFNYVGAIWFGFISGGIIFTCFIEPLIYRFNRQIAVAEIQLSSQEDDFELLARFTTDVSILSKKGTLYEAELSYPLDTVTRAIERINLIPDIPIDVQIAVKACDAYVKVFKMKRS